MATTLKLRRGTTTQHSTFTGAEGEVTVDTTKDTLVVHDGSTAGGFPLAKETGSAISATSLTDSGNLTFTGTGNRITGDFSNATIANRAMFQSSTTNGNTIVTAIPNGSATQAAWMAQDGPGPNASLAALRVVSGSDSRIEASAQGSGTFLPLTFYTSGSERMRIDTSGNVGIGVTPQAWSTGKALEVGGNGHSIWGLTSGTSYHTAGYYFNSTDKFAITGSYALFAQLVPGDGSFRWVSSTATGTAGNNATMTERARITSGGYFKASNSGSYRDSTATYHELYQTANSATLRVSGTNASLTAEILDVLASRNTTNNTFYAIRYYNDGAAAVKFAVADSGTVTNTTGTYGTISDAKLKQDIVDASSQWDDIKNLRFRKYRLKSEVELDPNAKPFIGLVAQEAELVSPGLIEEHRDTKQETKTREVEKTREISPAVLDEEGNEVTPAVTETYTETEEYTETVDLGTTTKSIKTSILYMKAVKALQEAQLRIEELEAQNAIFEARLDALESA